MELKKVMVGDCFNVVYLFYLGDVILGEKVNIGVGIIIVNYDGVKKYKIKIGDCLKIGLNSVLVVFVILGEDVIVVAGLVVIKNVEDDSLVIGCVW